MTVKLGRQRIELGDRDSYIDILKMGTET